MCEEWERRNPSQLPVAKSDPVTPPRTPGPRATSMKDTVADSAASEPPTPWKNSSARSAPVYDLSTIGRVQSDERRVLLERPELLTERAIDELSKAGFEITVTTTSGVEVTLVPDYTSQDRAELSFRNARTLVMVLQVFPGASIEALRKPNREAS